jgi:hypothetical protein
MAIKTFTSGEVLTSSDTNTYLNNGGLVYITEVLVTAGVSPTVSIDNCFSATYDNYRIVVDDWQPSSASQSLDCRLRVSGTDASGADYAGSYTGIYLDGTSAAANYTAGTRMQLASFNSTTTLPVGSTTFDLIAPFRAQRTYSLGVAILFNAQFGTRQFMGVHGLSTSYTGLTFLPNVSGNLTKLRVRIYGYRQA